MARMIRNALVCLLFAVIAVSAQGIVGFNVVAPTGPSTYVGLQSEAFFIDVFPIPSIDVQINLKEVDTGAGTNNLQFNPSTLTFGPNQRSQSFRVSSNNVGTFTFSSDKVGDSDTDPAYGLAPGGTVTFQIRPITIETTPSATVVRAGEPSRPLKISVPVASGADIVVTPSTSGLPTEWIGNNTITFSPERIVLPAGSLSTAFTYTVASGVVLPSLDLDWLVEGSDVDAGLYTDDLPLTTVNIGTAKREFTLFALPTQYHAVGRSNYLYVYTAQMANDTFTLTPQAADSSFDPPSITFAPNVQVARFRYQINSPGVHQINWQLSGPGALYYNNPVSTTITIPKRSVYVTMASQLVLTNRTYMSVALITPTPEQVTVTFYADNLRFPTGSVTFDANRTSFVLPVDPVMLGADTIKFKITGADGDKGWYNPIPDLAFSVAGANFYGPDNGYYIPQVWVGVQSPKIPIRASISPIRDVVLTPSAPNCLFNPLQLTFRNGSELQYFTVTPLYTNGQSGSYSVVVNFLVSGTDHAYFNAPSMTLNVQRRSIQTAWSPHLVNQDRNPTSTHIGKTYKIWTTVNYIGEDESVTVTPVSPYYSFNPKVISFSDKRTRVLLEATVTGISSPGSAVISYVIGGSEGGWYSPMTPDSRVTTIRPLAIEAALVAPDNRVPKKRAVLFDSPASAASAISQYHVYSFKLRSFVLPDGGLTITPRCAHATFSPRSITVKADDAKKVWDYRSVFNLTLPYGGYSTVGFNISGLYLEANFSVNPQANGNHHVRFDLTGKDAGFYDNFDTYMNFFEVERDSNEPKEGSAGTVIPSVAVFVVAFVCALFM